MNDRNRISIFHRENIFEFSKKSTRECPKRDESHPNKKHRKCIVRDMRMKHKMYIVSSH